MEYFCEMQAEYFLAVLKIAVALPNGAYAWVLSWAPNCWNRRVNSPFVFLAISN